MPFSRPTLSELIERTGANLEANMEGADSALRRSNINVFSRVLAMLAHPLYAFIAYVSKQRMTLTADAEELDSHGTDWGITRIASVFAAGTVNFTGANGTIIPADTLLLRGDGVEYLVDGDTTVTGGTATASVTARLPGAVANAEAAVVISLAAPIAGINTEGVVASGGIIGGLDEEDDETYRARILDRKRQPPHGGAAFDYIKWAKETAVIGPKITRIWVAPLEMGDGTVTIRFMMDEEYEDGIPQAADLTDVKDYIDTQRPVTVKQLYVVAPIADVMDPTFSVLTPNTAAVQAAIAAELKDLLVREAEPGGTILISHIREAISIAAGENNYVLDSPSADIEPETGHIVTLGTPSWPE
ncbi:MAG: baseplate J/gp47 family protein [Rhodospirillales bacterium]